MQVPVVLQDAWGLCCSRRPCTDQNADTTWHGHQNLSCEHTGSTHAARQGRGTDPIHAIDAVLCKRRQGQPSALMEAVRLPVMNG